MSGKRAVFYCSASDLIDPKYNQAARDAVCAACLSGYDIVSGGTVKGTMKVVCDEARKFDVRVVGVLPKFMKGLEYPDVTECIWTDRMSERKDRMREGTDVAIALPGGIGTLEELVETLTLAKLKRYSGKVIAYNFEGFYNPLKDLLDHYGATGMMARADRELLSFPETIDGLKALL